TNARPITHKVRVTTARSFFLAYLGVDPPRSRDVTPTEWLAIPEQHLRTVTQGAVFRDDLDELNRARTRLGWYPRDVWLYLLAAVYAIVATMHNARELTEPLPVEVSDFHNVPYLVIHGDRFHAAFMARITDPEVQSLPRAVGSTSQWVDSTDAQWSHWYGPL